MTKPGVHSNAPAEHLDSSGLERQFSVPLLHAVGDRALLVDFSAVLPRDGYDATGGGDIEGWRRRRVMSLDAAIERARLPGVVESIVAYASLLVVYDPAEIAFDRLCDRVTALCSDASALVPRQRRRWRVPVIYGGEHGPDLDVVAAHCGMSADGVIAAHSGARYEIAMFGFLPGFAYLAGLPPRLAVPRRTSPRTRVPSGGIGIGGAQTAIGSVEGPSGWHQIGRTPVRMFDVCRQPVVIFDIGDEVELQPIDGARFAALTAQAAAGEPVADLVCEAD